uniref:Large ribosomal subunit protein uL24c n=1 Tax=Sporolithon durum TaxID=48970 RepID=A0A141SD86_9FLOR|nr:ribosomal protein L24 [Sporolithon durum]AMK96254.1 ribosomal protein L24 [Sporolithon durum]
MIKIARHKIHVKKGDTVQIICGKYKGQTSEVTKVFTKKNMVLIKNINIKTKHNRPKQEGENGTIIRFEVPIHSSNVMIYSKKYKKRSRFNIEYSNNQKYRKLKKPVKQYKI